MISIEEVKKVSTELSLQPTIEEDSAHYAILIDRKNQKILVATYSNVFLLIDLLFCDKILRHLMIYRTQNTKPTDEDLENIATAIFGN